jgi:anti-anti-sigma factor
MEITQHTIEDVCIFTLHGRLDTPVAIGLEKALNQKADEGTRKLVLNLSKLNYLSSSGLRVFLGIHKRLLTENGKFGLACVPEQIMEILQLTQFDELMPLFDTEGDAVIEFCRTT